MERRVIVILGCTASGKGTLGRALAARLGGEIVSLDSMKIYRGMDIGTAKPTPEERGAVPHHLIDVADPWENFSVARFVDLADAAVMEIHARGHPVVAVGGTMLYFKCWYTGLFAGPGADETFRAALRARARLEGTETLHAELAGRDPAAAARIHRNDLRRIERALEVLHLTGQPISALQQQWEHPGLRRPDWIWTLIGLRRSREQANRRINARVKRMVAAGLVAEARRVWSDPRGVGPQASQAVGYAELFRCFAVESFIARTPASGVAEHAAPSQARGKPIPTPAAALDAAVEQIKINTRRLAKQQRTWLKTLRDVTWFDVDDISDPAALDDAVLRALATSVGPTNQSREA